MKPSPELVLNQAFAKIAMEMGPALPAGYGQGSATTTAVLLLMVAQEFGRAADVRARENRVMRALFSDAAKSVETALAAKLAAAAGVRDEDLTIATLDRVNGELKMLLIELHVWAEQKGERALELRILRFLSEAAAARQVFLPAM
ncbi:MAG: hypothetical protein K8R18_16585 [Parvibaculum sp.]|uniref:hypothetical protein n=1 Tax=Parvibaculum sp. TaxID=2024848 RepID=UPI0025D2227C|nr:hypothetical protein [Parvibaculum sp.]MCE9651238.1 hypothetical protein [Parvibaculum sp.]